MFPNKKTKIIGTIGPASQAVPLLEQLIKNGLNVARINFAHGDYATHTRTIANVRQAAANTGQRVAIMGDLPGPKMRIGELSTETVMLERGQSFTLQTAPTVGDQFHASLDFDALATAFKPGDRIYMNDGYIQLEVQTVTDQALQCTVVVGGELRARKGVNFPGIDLGIRAFTDHDHELLRFCAEQQVDAVSQSFVQGPEDILAVREAATALNYQPFVIAKLERAETVHNLEQILQVVDGIMVARGDLGVEIPIEEVAIVQKQMIRQANRYGKPVITATHMLESMINNRRPTRAEATDVANAILDGTDCVMLSGETAIGSFPDEAVAMMARIAQVAEAQGTVNDAIEALITGEGRHHDLSLEDRTALGVYHSARELEPAIIFTPTLTGATARRLARFKLPIWIVAFSIHEATCQQLQFSYGVCPEHVAALPTSWENYARHWCETHAIDGQLALLTEGTSQIRAGGTTRISILYL